MKRVLIFAERMLPSTQTFISLQVKALQSFVPQYVGLIPAEPSCALDQTPILLTADRSMKSRLRREGYRWTGLAPRYHERIRTFGANLLHAHFAEGASSAVAISSALRIPMVFHLRGGAEMLPDEELRKHPFQLPYLLWRRKLWKHTSLFLCVSDFIRRKALQAGFPEKKLRVHYTGIDLSRFMPGGEAESTDREMVLYVGRLVAYKGLDHLIRAIHEVRKSRPGTHLVVIGDGWFRRRAEALAKEVQVPCKFLGEQPAAAVRKWMSRARVFCLPSLTLPDGMSEAFGNVFTEAQAMGLPVVSYRHGGIPETMRERETGLLADEGNEEQLAACLARYLTDDGLWRHSRETGMTWVRENFDVFRQTAKLEGVYEEVLAAGPAHG